MYVVVTASNERMIKNYLNSIDTLIELFYKIMLIDKSRD